jgi:hypothetical protein
MRGHLRVGWHDGMGQKREKNSTPVGVLISRLGANRLMFEWRGNSDEGSFESGMRHEAEKLFHTKRGINVCG